MAESFAAAEKVKGQPDEKPLTAVNEKLGSILNSLDGADSAPTTVQSEAYVRARAELDRLLTPAKKRAAASTPEVPEDEYGETEP